MAAGRAPRVRAVLVAALTLATAVLTGCSSGSVASPPTGVDGLVVPTPSPDPDDFAAAVTSPWVALDRGTRRVYEVTDLRGEHRLAVSVTAGPVVAGVATTARVATEQGRTTIDWYAQDRSGNVWWFGRAGEWRAGSRGARAGLAVPAHPRVGDGWATAYVDGTVAQVATVTGLDAAVSVPAGRYVDVLVLRVDDPATGEERDVSLARGTGMVAEEVRRGGFRRVQLVRTRG